MSTTSPKERLAKLFRRSGSHHQDDRLVTPSPPATPPSSSGPQRRVRRSTSRKSLRDALHARTGSASQKRQRSGSANGVPAVPGVGSADKVPAVPSAPAQQRVSPETRHDAGVAATEAMCADHSHRIPSLPRESDLAADLRGLRLSSEAGGEQPFSEAVADRHIARGEAEDSLPLASHASHGAAQVQMQDLGTARGIAGSDPFASSSRRRSLSRKADVADFRRGSVDTTHAAGATSRPRSPRRSVDTTTGIARSNLDKPLPRSPSDEWAKDFEDDRVTQRQPGAPDLAKQLHGMIDLSKTEDVTLHEKYAPAVTHETIERRVHHIREEQITREIHNHHVFHRVLPIIDIEVLPARHFIPVEGGYAEISEDEVPGRAGPNAQWVIAETVSKLVPESKGPVVPTRFTARKFEGNDGDSREDVGADGIPRTETWWVHPPTPEDGGRQTGQTYPFHIGFPTPEQNGLQARLPEKKIIGVSPRLAQQRKEKMGKEKMGAAPQKSSINLQQREQAPPVPQHQTFPAALSTPASRPQPMDPRNFSRP